MLTKCPSSTAPLALLKQILQGNSFLTFSVFALSYCRTGKRTVVGSLNDGVNSLIRYYNNNFYDGYFEDCLHLMFNQIEMGSKTDKIIKQQSLHSTFVFPSIISHQQMKFLAILVLPAFLITLLLAQFMNNNQRQLFWGFFYLYIAFILYVCIKRGVRWGRFFVSKVGKHNIQQ